jgi:hypothetical protein
MTLRCAVLAAEGDNRDFICVNLRNLRIKTDLLCALAVQLLFRVTYTVTTSRSFNVLDIGQRREQPLHHAILVPGEFELR